MAHVHVPFSVTDLTQTEQRLGSFFENSGRCGNGFLHITQAFSLTWQDIHLIISSTLTPEERERIWQVAEIYVDELPQQNKTTQYIQWQLRQFQRQPSLTPAGLTRRAIKVLRGVTT